MPSAISMIGFHAFNLIEDVIALAMLGLSLAIVAPRYADALFRHRAQSAAGKIVADLANAQNRAKAAGSAKVCFSPTTNSYQVISPNAAGSEDVYAVSLSDPPLHATFFGADLGDGQTICFDARGIPDHGGSITVGAGETTRTIKIDDATGTAVIL